MRLSNFSTNGRYDRLSVSTSESTLDDDISVQSTTSRPNVSPVISRWTSHASTLKSSIHTDELCCGQGGDLGIDKAATTLLKPEEDVEVKCVATTKSVSKVAPDCPQTFPGNQCWRPPWLNKSTPLAFCGLYVGLIVALSLLWRVEVARNGFIHTAARNEYYWKYGPTAIFVVVVALWAQLDKHCRLVMPWTDRHALQSHRSQCLVLDYISPMPQFVLLNALRERHIAVVASVTGSIILKMIVAASTGLIVLTPTEFVNHGMNVMTTGQLNVSRFVASGPSANEVNIGTMLYYGHVAKGLPLRNGTDVSSAYQQPSMPDVIERDYTLTAPADIFIPGYQCVEVNTTNRFGDLNDDGSFELDLDVAPCPAALKDAPLNTTLMSTNLTIWTMPRKTRGPEESAFLHLDYYQFPCPEFLGIGSSPQVLMGERTVRGADPSIESTAFYVVSKLSLNSSDCRIKNYGIGDGMDCDVTAKLSTVTTVACTANFAAKQIDLSLRKAQRDSVRPFLLDTSHELSATDLSAQGFNNSLLQSVIPWLSEAAAGLSVIDYDMNSIDLYQPTYRVANNDNPIMLKRSGVEDGRDWHNLFEFFMSPIDAGGYASTINGTLLRHGWRRR